MASIVLTFNNSINKSVQVGDIIYYLSGTVVKKMGSCTALTDKTITCSIPAGLTRPSAGSSFIMFSKENKSNSSSLAGYYSEVKMSNDAIDAAELFQVSSEVSVSSK